jgi:hypothetical protein
MNEGSYELLDNRPAHALSLKERAERWPCVYTSCPLPGSIKMTADWFCTYHFGVPPEMGARITEDLKGMVRKGWRGEKDWRDELVNKGIEAITQIKLSLSPLYWEAYKEGFNKYGLRGNELVRWARKQALARGKLMLPKSPVELLRRSEGQKSEEVEEDN